MGDRVLIKPDEVEKVTEGGIIIPESETEKYAMAQSIGVIVEVGPDAWVDHVERDSSGAIIRERGFRGPIPKPGERVAFEKYGGNQMSGVDGVQYRIIRYQGISATVEEGVDFTDWKPRQSMRSQA